MDETKGGTQPVNLIIEGELTPDAPSFVDATNNITNRPSWTAANVMWSVPNWTMGSEKFQTPDISTIIQEIVNQDGWANSNALILIFKDDGTSTGIRCAEAFDGESTAAPLLHIEFVCNTATDPAPADGATGVPMPLIQWTAGDTAAWHDVYFGTNPDLGPADYIGRQLFATYWHGPGLTPGTTYYWRIDEVEIDGTTIHTGDVWSFTAAPLSAYNPDPANGAKHVPTNVTLSWISGSTAVTHDVYFGTNKADVAAGTDDTFKGNQPGETYTLEGLLRGANYYWRIDEVEADGVTKYTGEVWSFRTLPEMTITDPAHIGWWKFDVDLGNKVLDWSGYSNDGFLGGDPLFVEGIIDTALELNGNDHVSIDGVVDDITSTNITISAWIKTTQSGEGNLFAANTGGSSHPFMFGIKGGGDPYVNEDSDLGEYPPPVNDNQWHMLTYVRNGSTGFIYVDAALQATCSAAFDLGSVERWSIGQEWDDSTPSNFYSGLVDDAHFFNKPLTQEEVGELMRGPADLAWKPKPAKGSTPDIEHTTPLSWSPGDMAAQHDVYFGTDELAVEGADASDTTGIYRIRQAATSYTPPEGVEWGGGPYYWRIDEVNTDATISVGKIWSFTVADYLVVEDFEDYNDFEPDRIFDAWIDGWGVPANGSQVGYDVPPFAEPIIVHGGSQSMPFRYNNTAGVAYSEAERAFAIAQDWTRRGVNSLTLWFRGESGNAADQLYVALADSTNRSATVQHPDAATTTINTWTEWNIPLTDFTGVNAQAIKKISIGVGDRVTPQAGGSGKLYIDDIRLYRPQPAQ